MHKYACLILCTFGCFSNLYSQDFSEKAKALKTIIDSTHYAPKSFDDIFSEGVYNLVFDELNANFPILYAEDIGVLNSHKNNIDDYIKNADDSFIKEYVSIYRNRLEATKSHLLSLMDVPLDYSGKDTLHFYPENKFKGFKNDQKAKSYWRKRIRYNVISTLTEDSLSSKNIELTFKNEKTNIKNNVITKLVCQLDEMEHHSNGIENYIEETFLNAILQYQDPNSSYFNNSEKNLFESSVAVSQQSFGIFTEKQNNGDIVISHITPGSQAFNQGKLEVDDIIISLKAEDQTLETTCVSNNDIMGFLNNQEIQSIHIEYKKANGYKNSTQLTKGDLKVETNNIKGYLIDDVIKTAYIKIPSFYTDLESLNGLGVANDVAKELYKLKKENIDALIIDLRFNGGGSMKEASDLSGMFINRGPLAIVKDRFSENYTIRDPKRGSVYTKPMLILMNEYSASASEFFAAAMQDYNRAIIVGATSYGKASAQVIFPLGETFSGFAKITTDRFYRATGKSHQSKGVVPDIALPSLYKGFEISESFSEYAFQEDETETTLKLIPFLELPIGQLQKKSFERIKNNPYFTSVKKINTFIVKNNITNDSKIPLTLEDISKDIILNNTFWEDNKNKITIKDKSFSVVNTQTTQNLLEYEAEEKLLNSQLLKDLSEDIYIQEAHFILTDLQTLKNKQ